MRKPFNHAFPNLAAMSDRCSTVNTRITGGAGTDRERYGFSKRGPIQRPTMNPITSVDWDILGRPHRDYSSIPWAVKALARTKQTARYTIDVVTTPGLCDANRRWNNQEFLLLNNSY